LEAAAFGSPGAPRLREENGRIEGQEKEERRGEARKNVLEPATRWIHLPNPFWNFPYLGSSFAEVDTGPGSDRGEVETGLGKAQVQKNGGKSQQH
jgi:hypothetical protein